jgi:hypothetical protein
MTWPNTTPITTANVDSGLDNPALARIQIKEAIENINAVVAEFSNVAITSAANAHILQYNSTASQWQNGFLELHRFTERTANLGTQANTITINYNDGNVQRCQVSGNLAISFSNFPTSGTVTVLFEHGNPPAVASWPATVRASNNDRFLSTDANVTDMVHISTIGTSTYLVTVVRGFE